MTRITSTVVAALIVCAGSAIANAGIAEVSSERLIRTDSNAGGSQDGIYDVYGPAIYGAFSDDVSSYQDGGDGSYGSGYAYQNTTIDPGHYYGSTEAYASAEPDDIGFGISDGYGSSRVEVEFTITGTESFVLTGTGGGFGSINGAWASDSYVAIESITGGTPTQVFLDEDDNYINFGGSGPLLPGDYRFVVDSVAGIQFIFDTGSYVDTNAGVSFDLAITPTPSSLALLGFAGAVSTRRRRK